MTTFAPRLDVSHLPEASFGNSTALWWGNTLLLFIETAMFALLAATYFYLRQGEQHWPPVNSNAFPPMYNTLPDLWCSTTILGILLLGCIPMALTHLAALHLSTITVRLGLIACILICIAATVFRFFEFSTLHFYWNESAYGSITWMILGMHLFHLLTVTCELGVLASYILFHPLKPKRALDVTLGAIYYYWILGMWILFYIIIYWSPRWTYTAPHAI